MRVNGQSGNREFVSACFDIACLDRIGDGPTLGFIGDDSAVLPAAIAVEATGSLVVVDFLTNSLIAVVRVDPMTGDRRIISFIEP